MHAFTTRADTIMGVTFCAVAADTRSPCTRRSATAPSRLHRGMQAGSAIEAELAVQEKKGMPTGLAVRHPITGDPVPVWVANYVLMSYGEGAVMACLRTTSGTWSSPKIRPGDQAGHRRSRAILFSRRLAPW